MNDNNINLLVLKSFFDNHGVWLEDIELLGSDYAMLTRKLLSIELKNGKLPSLALIIKSLDKINFNIEDEIDYKKRVKAILNSLLDINVELEQDELLELLREQYLQQSMFEELPKLTKCLTDKNFEKVKLHLNKLDNILETGTANNVDYEDNEELFLRTDSVLNFKDMGFPKEFAFSRLPEGSMLLVSSRSKTGKTSLLIGSLTENFVNGMNCYIASFEIPRVSIINRMLSYISDVPLEEINNGVYSVAGSDLRVLVARYVLSKDIKFKEASRIMLEQGEEGLKELPTRPNKLIIKASLTKEELIKFQQQNRKPPEMPTDLDIIKDVKDYNKVGRLDFVYIDYVSLINFSDQKLSREQNIANFSKSFKRTLLETSTIGILLSQSKSAQEFYMPLFSTSPLLDCDASISVQPSKAQNEQGLTTVHLYVSRHFVGNKSWECEKRLDVQKFIPTGNEMDFEDFLTVFNKENKDKSQKS